MSNAHSIYLALCMAAALGCGEKRNREPNVPGTNANAPRVVEAEDPETHERLADYQPPPDREPVDREKLPLATDAGVVDTPPAKDAGR